MADRGITGKARTASFGADSDDSPDTSTPTWTGRRPDVEPWYDRFPWWFVVIAAILLLMGYIIASGSDFHRFLRIANGAMDGDLDLPPQYNTAYDRIIPGFALTISTTLRSFALACAIGLLAGLGRTLTIDNRTRLPIRIIKIFLRNLARTYVEFIRGIPIIVLIFAVNFVLVPEFTQWLWNDKALVSSEWRAIIALGLIYGGYMAEIFRAGIQAVDRGQLEASRSLGMSRWQTTTSVILPQAIRTVVPPLGNDFIAVLKDSSLLSLIGVLELTRLGDQYAASTFRFREAYLVLAFVYLTLTVILSLALGWLERWLTKHNVGAR